MKIAFGTFMERTWSTPRTGGYRRIADGGIAAIWSPEGNLLVFTDTISGEHQPEESAADLRSIDLRRTELEIFDMRNGKTSRVPDSEGKLGAEWVTQDTLVAATEDNTTRSSLFDCKTQKWTELASGLCKLGCYPGWEISLLHDRRK
jgi:hypothetical protein